MEPVKLLFGIFFILTLLAYWAQNALAATPPILLEPTQNQITTDTSPTLSWGYSSGCPADQTISCFKVEIDDLSDFASINKYSYTNSLSYTPQNMGLGKWFWRVKAKDTSNNWSEFSESRAFTISQSTSGVGETEVVPTSTPSPTAIASTSSNVSSFTITGAPILIDSNASFPVKIQINNLTGGATYYLKGAFYKEGSTNYFGKSLVSGSWIKNSETFSKQLKIQTDSGGDYSGEFSMMPDSEDSGFTGSGDYFFKVGRYNSSGGSLTWGDSLKIYVNKIAESSKLTTTAKPADKKDVLAVQTSGVPSSLGLKNEASSSGSISGLYK